MTTSRSKPRSRLLNAWALEPRMMFDAAIAATAETVVAATDSAPGVTASAATATITIDDSSSAQSVDLFSNVTVTSASDGDELSSLVITVDSSGSNQALVIDGSTIALTTGSGETADSGYTYSVTVSGGVTTITVSIASSQDGYTADGAASLIDSIEYQALDNTVESGTVTVTLSSLSDDGDTATLDISATVTIDSDVNAAPTLSDDSALEAAESIDLSDLGDDAQVVYSSDGSYAYVAGDGAISVFSVDDSGRLTLQSTLAVDALTDVTEMAISPDGSAIYAYTTATDSNGNLTGSVVHLSVADDGTVSYVSTTSITYATQAGGGLAVSDDGSYLYVGTWVSGVQIYSIDGDSGELTYIGSTSSSYRNGIITTSGDYVYVVYGDTSDRTLVVYQRNDDGTLSEIASDAFSTFTSISNTGVDYSLAVSDDGLTVYIADPENDTIMVYRFDGSSLSLAETLSLTDVKNIALSSDGSVLYGTTSDGAIYIYSVSSSGTLTLVSSVADADAGDIAIASDGLSLLITTSSGVTRYTIAQTLDQESYATFASGMTVADSNYDQLNDGEGNYNGASITVSASVTGGTFGFEDGNGLTYADGVISLDGSAIATLSTSSDGVLTVKFTADVTTDVANQVLQQLTYANDSATAGSYIQLTIAVSDSALTSNSVVVTLRVNATPEVNTDASTGYALDAATSETAYSFTLFSGLFSDADGDSLTWSVSGLPDGLTFDAETHTISGAALEAGTFTVTVTVTDSSGATASLTLELAVTQIANRAPEVNDDVSTTLDYATESADYSVTLDSALFTDADSIYGDTLTWTVSGLPDGFTFDADTLTISGSSSVVGDYTFTVTVTDQLGATASVVLTLRVITTDEANNSAPDLDVAASDLSYTAEGGLSGYSYYVNDLVLSSDDSTLVVVGNSSANNAATAPGTAYISVYSRDTTTGELTLTQTFVQGATNDGDDSNGIEIDGLSNANAVVYSADGQYVYITGKNSAGSYVINVFSVNDDGTLSYVSQIATGTSSQLKALAVSDDGTSVYATSTNTIYSFSVGSDGTLTLMSEISLSSYSSSNVYDVAYSNGYVYVLAGAYIVVYDADENGALTQVAAQNGFGFNTAYYPRAFVVTDDGYIYVANAINSQIITIYFDSEAGTLTKVATTSVGAQSWGVSLSSDGTALYVGTTSSTIVVYRIGDDGSLTKVTTVAVSGGRAYRIVMTSDGTSIYAGGFFTTTGLAVVSTSTTVTVSYTEGGSAATLASAITLSDEEYDALNDGEGNYNGAVITVAREGGADSSDSYSFTDGNGLTLVDGTLYLDGVAIATFVSEGGTLTVTFTGDVTTAVANLVLQQITYTNTGDDPGSSIQLTLSVADEYASSSTGISVSVTEVNDAPTLDATAGEVVYTSGGNGVKLFSDSAISTVEDGQTISGITLTVSGLSDGDSETLVVNGVSVALTDGSSASGAIDVTDEDGTTTSYSFTLSVSVDSDGVATVTISGSLPSSVAQTLLESIAYANASDTPTEGARTVTLTSIQDSGGTSNDGVDTTALAVSATVTVKLSNSAPTLTASAASISYTEGDDAATLFSDVTLDTGEAGQTISSITLTVSGLSDGESETLTVDGVTVTLVDGVSGTTASGYAYAVTVSDGVATLTLSSSDGIASDDAVTLLESIAYANTSDDPTAGARTVTLSAVQDDGGTGNGGSDTTALAIAASVTVVAVNDAPTLDATATTVSYTSTGDSVSLFSDVTVSTVESGQTITSVTFTVAGLLDGGSETLTIDGATLSLTAGSGTTSSGYSYRVTVDGDTATVTITFSDGLSADDTAALIEGVSYANLDSTKSAGTRTVSVSVQDSGGGDDATALAASASVEVVENSAPQLSADADYNDLTVADSLTSISGLSDIAASALSSDGDYLYVISSDGSIAIFLRNTSTGELVLQQTLDTGLSSASAIVVSDDGSTVYVLGDDGDALVIYSRDSSDGSLTLVQTLATQNVTDFAVSSDGSTIYVVDGNYSGLLVYTLDSSTGEYALSQSITASTSSEPYLFTGVSIEVVGDYVYVVTDPAADSVANTLIVYQVGSDGTLTAVAYLRDGEADVSISSPVDIAVSSDGGLIYVASDDSIAIFSFDGSTLTYVGAVTGLSDITAVALSSDDGTLYVTSSDGSISRYSVGDDGTLTLLQTLDSSEDAALAGAASVVTASDGAVVVVGSGGLVSLKDGLAEQVTIAYTEQGTVLLADVLTLSDADYDALNDGAGNYNGATITVTGGDGSDSYGFADGNGLTLADGTLYLDGSAIATFTSSDGTLTIVFTADVTTEVANQVLQQITYASGSDDPDASIALTLSVTDAYDASVSVTLMLNVTAVNDAPTLTASATSVTYTEGDDAVTLFSDATVDVIEAGQSVSSLTLTVSGVSDGESETLTLDGTAIALVSGSGTTASGYSYTVTVDGDTVTLIVSSADGIDAAGLIDAVAYANASDDPTEGDRTVTLISVTDSGGTDNGGSDTTELAIAATVTVVAVNDAPIVTATGASVAYTEGDGEVALFSDAAVDTVEADQNVVSLTLIVSGVSDGASETLTLDGTAIALVSGSGTTSSGYSYIVTVDGDTVPLTLSSADGIAAASLIDAVTYANDSDDPTEGVRTVTLSAVADGDGSNSASPAISATVSLSAVNDTPTVAASGATVAYTEGDEAVTLFSDAAIDVIEADQSVASLTFTLSGVSDGASEILTLDGTAIALVAGSGATASGYSWTVTVDNGVVTLTVSSASGITDAAALLNGIAYANASEDPTEGVRTVTLTRVQDNGGGADSVEPNIAASVTVVAVNDAPQASADAPTLAQATRDKAYSATLSADLFSDVDDASLNWSVTGLPDGLTFDAATLTISGTPTVAGRFTLTLTATDAQGAQSTLTLTLTVGQREVNPVVQASSPATFDAAPQGGIFDAMTNGEDQRRPAAPVAALRLAATAAVSVTAPLGGETQPSSPLATGPLDYAAAPWVLDPIMPSLMPPLEQVNFTAPAGRAAANADRVYRLPADANFSAVQLANGRPLPAWVQFDAQRGELRLNDAPRVGQIQLLLTRADGSEQLVTLRDGPAAPVVTVEAAPVAAAAPQPVADGDAAAKAAFSQKLTAERGDSDALLRALQALAASDSQPESAS